MGSMQRLVFLCFCLCLLVRAQTQMNVEQLAQFIRSELALGQHSDRQIAAAVKKLSLSEKLTDKTITDLGAQGAGPKTVAALKELEAQSVSKPAGSPDATSSPATAHDPTEDVTTPTVRLAPKGSPIPAPDSVRQREILDSMRSYAMNYTATLPNFVCVEVMRRFIDFDATDRYRSLGNVLAKVSYNEGHESYKVYSVNGKLHDASLDHASIGGGAVSTGEFGSLMQQIFDVATDATFNWDHWGTLRGRRMAVFSYGVDSGHSKWTIDYSAGPGDEQRIVTAYKGLVYADENTGEVARIKFVATDIPATFPVTQANETLDYDLVDIGGEKFVCPLLAKLNMTAANQRTRNEIEFRNYRKFGTETSIQYDLSAKAAESQPLDSSKTEEQPVVQTKAPSAQTGKATPGKTSSSPFGLPTAPPPPPNP